MYDNDPGLTKIVEFIRELYNKPEGIIPLHEPVFTGNEKKYVLDCIDSTFLSGFGKYVELFEKEICKVTGSRYAVSLINGTSALHIGLHVSGVKPGDEVLTQSFTYVATANAVRYCGADPVFIDVDRDTLGMSPEKLSHFLKNNTAIKRVTKTSVKVINKTTNKQITAVLPVHVFGHPCRIDEIIGICSEYDLPVIEDAAESIGSFYKNKHTGTFGDFGVLSFNGNKTLTTGGGGMLLTGDEQMASIARHLSNQAKIPEKLYSGYDYVGFNYVLPALLAAVGLAQSEQLEKFIKKKRIITNRYIDFFKDTGTIFVKEPDNCRSNYWLNSIIFNKTKIRNEFLKYSNSLGICTRPPWPLINELGFYSGCFAGDLTNSYFLSGRIVNLPSSYSEEI